MFPSFNAVGIFGLYSTIIITVVCDVLPSVDVGCSGIEQLNPGQQGELTDEFAACFSEEPVLCRVCRIWLLFVFLVCGVVVLSMTACFEYEIVKAHNGCLAPFVKMLRRPFIFLALYM